MAAYVGKPNDPMAPPPPMVSEGENVNIYPPDANVNIYPPGANGNVNIYPPGNYPNPNIYPDPNIYPNSTVATTGGQNQPNNNTNGGDNNACDQEKSNGCCHCLSCCACLSCLSGCCGCWNCCKMILDEPIIMWDRFVMFWFFWLGARRFQPVGSRHFDPADVKAFRSYKDGKWAFLLQNFHVRWSIEHFFDRKGCCGTCEGQILCCSCCCWAHVVEQGTSTETVVTAPVQQTTGGGVQDVQIAIEGCKPKERLVYQHFPFFVVIQSAACIFFWVYWIAQGPSDAQLELYGEGAPELDVAGLDSFWPGQTQLLWSSHLCDDLRAEVWRWWTYQYTFWSGWHLLGNVVGLVFLGTSLEGLLGSARVFVAFNFGIIGSAIMYFIFEAHRMLLGMSGGVFALLGMHFQQLFMNWSETRHHWFTLFVLVALACLEILALKTDQLFTSLDMAISCNLGGLVAGFLISADLIMDFKVSCCERVGMLLGSALFIITLIFCIYWLVSNEDKPINVFEKGVLPEGYCWYKQSVTYYQNYTVQECVRCATRSCIDLWTHLEGRTFIHLDDCRAQGWFYAGR
mmetsp:Transcript_78257/g.162531  ORF Transcript_78257/g.162531 Transcript_78257/m.162531 type:complete len:571 (-) Transcript_78257:436-2148(-)